VQAAGGMLWYSSDAGRFPGQISNYQVGASGPYVRVNLEAYSETTEDPAARVARQALDELQDYVDEASHEPWPGTGTPPPAVRRDLRAVPPPVVWRAGYHQPGDTRLRTHTARPDPGLALTAPR